MNKKQFETIVKWQDEVFTSATVMSCINHLEEEVQEMKVDFELGLISDLEIADCFMLLFGVANKAGLKYEDVVSAIDAKMQINYKRKWKLNEKGYAKHV